MNDHQDPKPPAAPPLTAEEIRNLATECQRNRDWTAWEAAQERIHGPTPKPFTPSPLEN